MKEQKIIAAREIIYKNKTGRELWVNKNKNAG